MSQWAHSLYYQLLWLSYCSKWHFGEDYTGMSTMLEKMAWAFFVKALGPVTHCGSGSPHGASQAIHQLLGEDKDSDRQRLSHNCTSAQTCSTEKTKNRYLEYNFASKTSKDLKDIRFEH